MRSWTPFVLSRKYVPSRPVCKASPRAAMRVAAWGDPRRPFVEIQPSSGGLPHFRATVRSKVFAAKGSGTKSHGHRGFLLHSRGGRARELAKALRTLGVPTHNQPYANRLVRHGIGPGQLPDHSANAPTTSLEASLHGLCALHIDAIAARAGTLPDDVPERAQGGPQARPADTGRAAKSWPTQPDESGPYRVAGVDHLAASQSQRGRKMPR
jgi:hypothetical protein